MFKQTMGHPAIEEYLRQLDEQLAAGGLPSYDVGIEGVEVRTSQPLSGAGCSIRRCDCYLFSFRSYTACKRGISTQNDLSARSIDSLSSFSVVKTSSRSIHKLLDGTAIDLRVCRG